MKKKNHSILLIFLLIILISSVNNSYSAIKSIEWSVITKKTIVNEKEHSITIEKSEKFGKSVKNDNFRLFLKSVKLEIGWIEILLILTALAQVLLIVFKLTGVLAFSWFLVLMPLILVALTFFVIWLVIAIAFIVPALGE
jgi:hypothetical protein